MIEGERDQYIQEKGGRRNGYWKRSLETELGKIQQLRVVRVREGGFYPSALQPYARRVVELDKLIIALYEAGVSTRKISSILRRFYGSEASAALISSVTERVAEKLKQWRRRPLPRRLAAAYIDAGFFDVRRDTVEKEAVYFVLGVDEEGRREIIHFVLATSESATAWKEVLAQLRQRGLQEVEFIVADGLSGSQKP